MERRGGEAKLFRVRLYREDLGFSAGHISTYGPEMEGQHGHNYQLSIEFEGLLDEDSLVIDFRTVKKILRSIAGELNHRTIVPALHPRLKIDRGEKSTRIQFGDERIEFPTSNLVFLDVPNVTSEMLAYYFYRSVRDRLPAEDRRRLRRVTVEIVESPGQSASYSGGLEPGG